MNDDSNRLKNRQQHTNEANPSQLAHKPIGISFGLSNLDNRPMNFEFGQWDEFAQFIADHKSAEKGRNYITSYMGGDGRRCKVNAIPRNWIPMDFDGIDSDKAQKNGIEPFNLDEQSAFNLIGFFSGLKCLVYQTASSKSDAFRLRFIVALDDYVAEEDAKLIGGYLERSSGLLVGWDKSVYQASQPLYLPPIHQALLSFEGDVLPVQDVLAVVERPKPKPIRHFKRTDFVDKSISAYEFFTNSGLVLSQSPNGGLDVVCPWAGMHSDGDITGSVYFIPSVENNFVGGFKCQHTSCEGKSIVSIFRLMEGKQ